MSNLMLALPSNPSIKAAHAAGDHRVRFADAIARRPIDPAQATAFLHSKMFIARTHAAQYQTAGADALPSFAQRLGSVPASQILQPAPGGVGYGMFYDPTFKTNFTTGTELVWNAICPDVPGGNVSNYLYLTATNRSAYGVEALVAYNGADQFSFQIYDWARPAAERWQANTMFAELNTYLVAHAYQGGNDPALPIWNSTVRLSPGQWRNSVYLFDITEQNWVLVYQYDYAIADDAQRAGWVGSWAPIVETFQPIYSGTNPLGALGTQLRSADPNGQWAGWTLLDPSMSTLRTDNVGFRQSSLDPNYDWTVTS